MNLCVTAIGIVFIFLCRGCAYIYIYSLLKMGTILCCRCGCYGNIINTSQLTCSCCVQTKNQESLQHDVQSVHCFLFNNENIIANVSVKVLLSFFECLAVNKCSVSVISNYVSAIKANFIVYDLPFHICDHPKIKYFIKSLKVNRPLTITHHNIVDIPMLRRMSDLALTFPGGVILKAVILMGFFTFLCLSNLCPHSLASFDPSRHLTGGDVLFTKQYVKLVIKWSKTMKTRDSAQILTLPRSLHKKLCPRSALKALQSLYLFDNHSPLFQWQGLAGWVPLTDSRVRKTLKRINLSLGLNPSHFTVSADQLLH